MVHPNRMDAQKKDEYKIYLFSKALTIRTTTTSCKQETDNVYLMNTHGYV